MLAQAPQLFVRKFSSGTKFRASVGDSRLDAYVPFYLPPILAPPPPSQCGDTI